MGLKTTDVVCFKLPLFQITEFHAFKISLPLFSEACDLLFKWIFKKLTLTGMYVKEIFHLKYTFFSLKLLETHWKYDRSTIRAVSLCIHTASNKPHRIPSWQIGRACYSLFTQKPLCFLLLYFNTAELPTSKSKILPQDSQKGILKLSLESIFFLLISNFPALACPPSSQRAPALRR